MSAALSTVGLVEGKDARVVHITNTLLVSEVMVSEAYVPEIVGRKDLEIQDGPGEMRFESRRESVCCCSCARCLRPGGKSLN